MILRNSIQSKSINILKINYFPLSLIESSRYQTKITDDKNSKDNNFNCFKCLILLLLKINKNNN